MEGYAAEGLAASAHVAAAGLAVLEEKLAVQAAGERRLAQVADAAGGAAGAG